jgi:hypothetical protein
VPNILKRAFTVISISGMLSSKSANLVAKDRSKKTMNKTKTALYREIQLRSTLVSMRVEAVFTRSIKHVSKTLFPDVMIDYKFSINIRGYL